MTKSPPPIDTSHITSIKPRELTSLRSKDDMHSMWNADFFLDRAQELVKKAIDEHAKYTTAELDRSRPVKKGAATRRQLGEQGAVNMHTMGTSFVGKVRNVRQI